MSKILVVDDDYSVAESVQMTLSRGGYITDTADCVSEAENLLAGFAYDLIILDWMMPEMAGIDFLQKLRRNGVATPILMLTGMNAIENKITGLDTGADDYITKPFNPSELLSRVRAVLRRPKAVESDEISVAGVTLNARAMRVTWQGADVRLTKQEFQLLEFLMRNKDEIFSHDALVERAWSSMSESSPDTVRVHMSRLRKKFEDIHSPCPLRTMHGKGYAFVSDNR